ncbi:hypothetical protein ACFV9C_40875 [Kribbella sp. NPDC059898]|uniref:hypothetical protein n=1 Tax=Kribbella sp. NPDC059898 TaxID=3346995 RepID=UPI00364BC7D7
MEWEDLFLPDTAEWAAELMGRYDLPPILTYAPPAVQDAEATRRLRDVSLEPFDLSGGLTRIRLDQDPYRLWESALVYLYRTVPERQVYSEEDGPPSYVDRQVLTRIAGLPSIGPGGRMIWFDLPSGPFIDIGVRPLASLRPSAGWRAPGQIQTAVDGLVGAARGFTLRGALGYTEPSRYEPARAARPMFVFVLDGPPLDGGPHWRVSIAVPATLDDGDGNGTQDVDWCV